MTDTRARAAAEELYLKYGNEPDLIQMIALCVADAVAQHHCKGCDGTDRPTT